MPPSVILNGLLVKLPSASQSHTTSTTSATRIDKLTHTISITTSPASATTLSLPSRPSNTIGYTPLVVLFSWLTTTCHHGESSAGSVATVAAASARGLNEVTTVIEGVDDLEEAVVPVGFGEKVSVKGDIGTVVTIDEMMGCC